MALRQGQEAVGGRFVQAIRKSQGADDGSMMGRVVLPTLPKGRFL